MAKITDANFAGVSGNILSPKSWLNVVFGAMMLIIGFATAQSLVKRVPNVPFLDKQPDPIFSQPVVQQNVKEVY